jgi:hypothetical protein
MAGLQDVQPAERARGGGAAAVSARGPGGLVHIDIKKLGKFNRAGNASCSAKAVPWTQLAGWGAQLTSHPVR